MTSEYITNFIVTAVKSCRYFDSILSEVCSVQIIAESEIREVNFVPEGQITPSRCLLYMLKFSHNEICSSSLVVN
jgi:hypothetical protein